MSIAPFLRPDLDQAAEQLPLYITGTLAGGKPGDAYEGRLQIHNQIGACVVLSVTGDDLPVGGTVSIDGNEVVVAWPAYAEAAAPITNPGFEDGMAGWQGGAGWSTTTDNPIAGTRSAVFKDAPGSSILSSLSRYPVDAGDTIHASAAIRQGASSAGNAGAGVRLEFRDAAGALVGHKDGNMVMSASNNAVKPSTVTVTPGDRPAGTELVNIACHGLRKRQNREVWADTFAWDHAVAAAGINADATICITIQIKDSAGRTAIWSGCVIVVSHFWDGAWIKSNSPTNYFMVDHLWIEEWGIWVASFYDNVNGKIFTSSDGVTWTYRLSISSGWVASNLGMSLAWSPLNKRLLLAQAYHPLITVDDPVTFAATYRTSPGDYLSISWSAKKGAFVAISGSTIWISGTAEAGSWTSYASPISGYARAFAYDERNGVFVVLNKDGKTWTSPDLVTWTHVGAHPYTQERTRPALFFSRVLNKLVFLQQQGSGLLAASPDAGVTWATVDSYPSLPYTFCESTALGDYVVCDTVGNIYRVKDGIMNLTLTMTGRVYAFRESSGVYLGCNTTEGGAVVNTDKVLRSNSS